MSTRDEGPTAFHLDSELQSALHARAGQGLRRSLRTVPDGVLDLASNDYLGLSQHPAVISAAQRAIARFGTGARASRLVSGQTCVHEELETALADFKQCQAALVFSSGYAANLAVITALARSGDVIFCDKRNHASLIDACRLASATGAQVRYYGSPDKLRALLESTSTRSDAARKIIVSDAVYSMDGDIADVPELLGLAEEFDASLILDDAHGLGTLGATGRGAVEHFGIENHQRLIQVGTLSKSLGAQGGFVVGSRVLVDWLVNTSRPFIYSTGLAPASCAAALAALRVLAAEPQGVVRLHEVANGLANGLQELDFDVRRHGTPILPVIIGDSDSTLRWSGALLEARIWCPAIRPPTVPAGSSRLRITASAALSDEDIEWAVQIFARVRHEYSKGSSN